MRVLAFGTYDVTTHPRFAAILEGLRAHGDHVVEVNAPLGLDTGTRVAILRQPWRLPLLGLTLVARWLVLAVRGRRAWSRLRPDVVLVGYLGHFDVRLARLLFGRDAVIVLDHLIFAADTARDRGVRSWWKLLLLQRLDVGALRAADVVLLDTSEHAALMPPELAERVVVAPVGAPAGWYDAGAARRPVGTSAVLRVVFFGLFTPLQGAPCIGRALGVLADEPNVTALLIGQGQDLDATRSAAAANPRVSWRSWVPSSDLPALVAEHDVCLGIFGTTDKALRVVPNKVYQGAAAGCATVTSDTPAQRHAFGEAARYVAPGDAHALAAVLRELAADLSTAVRLGAAARARAEENFRPEAVVRTLRERLLPGVDPSAGN